MIEMPTPPPPNCGKRLLPHLVDERAASGHERAFASIPRTKSARDGYIDISYATLANAVNRLALWILEHVGSPRRPCETLVYLAPSDLRYQIIALAAAKTGFIVSSSVAKLSCITANDCRCSLFRRATAPKPSLRCWNSLAQPSFLWMKRHPQQQH